MNFFGIGRVVENVGKIADDLITTDEERLKLSIEEKRIDAQIATGQVEVNKFEAQHRSIFVAGWRPFVGWVCGAGFAYHFILQPFASFIMIAAGVDLPDLPKFDMQSLQTVLMGMLGLGGLRTFEKIRGKAK